MANGSTTFAGNARSGAGSASRSQAAEGKHEMRQVKQINMQICRAADQGSVNGLLNVVAARQADMNCINISTALHRLARLAKESINEVNVRDPRFLALRSCTMVELKRQLAAGPQRESLPRCWATISWAYAILPVRDPELTQMFEIICKLAIPQLQTFKTFELTNLLWASAKVVAPCAILFQTACDVILFNVHSFSASNLATIAWSFVTVHSQPAGMLYRIAEEFGRQIDSSDVRPVELANLLWGLATARLHPKKTWMHMMGCKARDLLSDFKVQELTITAWAFSRLGARHDELFLAIAHQLIDGDSIRQRVHTQGAANLLWAFERQQALGSVVSSELVQATHALIPRCLQILPQLKLQELTCILHAIMQTGLRWCQCPTADQLFTSAASLTQPHIDRFTVSQCLNLLQAFAGFAPSGCGAPESCISMQRILVAACRSKSLKSASGQRNSHSVNLMGTALGNSAPIQCEDTESQIGQTPLDDNNDVETSARTFLNLTQSGLTQDFRDELLSALACTLLKSRLDGLTAADLAQLARVCGLPQNSSASVPQLSQALAKIANCQLPTSFVSQQQTMENMETQSTMSSDSDSIPNSSSMSTWNNFNSHITPDLLHNVTEDTIRSKYKTPNAGQIHAQTMPSALPRLSDSHCTSGPVTIGDFSELSFQQPETSALSSIPIPKFVRTSGSASSRFSPNEDPGDIPWVSSRPLLCQTDQPVCSRAAMPVTQISHGDQDAAERFFSDHAFDSLRRALNCQQEITINRDNENQVFLPHRGEQQKPFDTDRMQRQTQASTIYSTMPLDSESSAVNNFTARPVHALVVATGTHHSTQITAQVYDGGPLLESVAV